MMINLSLNAIITSPKEQLKLQAEPDCTLFDMLLREQFSNIYTSYDYFNQLFVSDAVPLHFQYIDATTPNYALISLIISAALPCEYRHFNYSLKTGYSPQVYLISTRKVPIRLYKEMAEVIFREEMQKHYVSQKKGASDTSNQFTFQDISIFANEVLSNIHVIEVCNEIELLAAIKSIPCIRPKNELCQLVVCDYINLYAVSNGIRKDYEKINAANRLDLLNSTDVKQLLYGRIFDEIYALENTYGIKFIITKMLPYNSLLKEIQEKCLVDIVGTEGVYAVSCSNREYSSWLIKNSIVTCEGDIIYARKDIVASVMHLLVVGSSLGKECKYYGIKLYANEKVE